VRGGITFPLLDFWKDIFTRIALRGDTSDDGIITYELIFGFKDSNYIYNL
jgi:hypothetical protein